MKRFFDATPRFMIYLVASVALAVLSLPYWLDWFPVHPVNSSFVLPEEMSTPVAQPTLATAQSLRRPTSDHTNSPLSRFGQVRLNAPREEMLKTFDLHALTVYASDPEIYEASKPTIVEHFTGCFSSGTLKEAFVIEREQQTGADALQQELVKQYGPPTERVDNNSATTPPSLLSQNAATEWVARMASLPFHRNLVWNDANYHIEASIHYSSVDPAQSHAILAVHLRSTTSPLNQTLSQYTAHTLSIRPAVE